jgi:hypothetical protein
MALPMSEGAASDPGAPRIKSKAASRSIPIVLALLVLVLGIVFIVGPSKAPQGLSETDMRELAERIKQAFRSYGPREAGEEVPYLSELRTGPFMLSQGHDGRPDSFFLGRWRYDPERESLTLCYYGDPPVDGRPSCRFQLRVTRERVEIVGVDLKWHFVK